MANVGKLTVSLTALTGQFGEGMREGAKHITAFTHKVHEMASKVGEAGKKLLEFAGVAQALSLGGLAYLTHEAAEVIEKTSHLADQLGTTTESLIGMQYAAKEAGVGAEEFGQAMRHLEKNLGQPSTEVSAALDKIHLSAATLMGQDASVQFGRIADGIRKLGTQSEKAAVAAALFGRGGVALLGVLQEGSQGIDDQTAKVKKLGAAFSSIDAQQVIEANHALEAMHVGFSAIFTNLAVKFSPFITEASNKLIELGTDGTSVADSVGNAFIDVARKMLRLIDIVDAAKAAFYALGGVAFKAAEYYEKFESYAVSKIAGAANFVSPGTISESELTSATDELKDKASEFADLASRAFGEANKDLRSAIDGERSMAAQAGFDRLIAAARARATAVVAEKQETKALNSEADKQQKMIAGLAAFAWFAKKGSALGSNVSAAVGGVVLENEIARKVAAFFHGLPARAYEMGWRPEVDPQTAVHGTFSGEAAGRQAGALTLQAKQLEETKKQTSYFQQLLAQFAGGVPAP